MAILDLFKRCISGPYITGACDTQYKIERVNGFTYLSFQGSVSKEDWLDNFSFWVKPYKNMPVKWFAHAGFIKRWKAVREEILKELQFDKIIIVLGYSQGAGIALLAYEDIQFSYPYKTVIGHGFGCPRVVSWLSKNIWSRFDNFIIHNNRRDIVGKIPFRFLGYRHVNKPTFTGKRGFMSVKEHLIAQYMERL